MAPAACSRVRMKLSEAPAFIRETRKIPPRNPARAALKTARKRGKTAAPRYDGDTGTAEMKQRQKVLIENRGYSSTGHVTSVGARVESQLPLDRHKNRNEHDPTNTWRNLMLWQSAERLRTDFEASGLAPKVCGSFQPRVTGGGQTWDADHKVDAWKRYKKAMDAVGQSLRPIMFWVCIGGEAANDWARRNGMLPQAGLPVLRLALAELSYHYGYIKPPRDFATREGSQATT
jgi:hypothetical protein